MNFAQDIWQMTWEQCKDAHLNHGWPLVTMEGHLIASRDRKLNDKAGHEMYLSTLALAYKTGREIPEEVLLSEPELFSRLSGKPIVTDELAAFDKQEEVVDPAEEPIEKVAVQQEPSEYDHIDLPDGGLFGGHLDWLGSSPN